MTEISISILHVVVFLFISPLMALSVSGLLPDGSFKQMAKSALIWEGKILFTTLIAAIFFTPLALALTFEFSALIGLGILIWGFYDFTKKQFNTNNGEVTQLLLTCIVIDVLFSVLFQLFFDEPF